MSAIPNKTLRETVACEIRTKILNQELLPGMRIVEQSLAEEFNVSRAPIREALRQLEQEGLVEYTRNAGCSVRRITLKDLYEVYLLRCQFEMMAVRLSKSPFTPEELSGMEDVLSDMQALDGSSLSSMMHLDQQFHEIIIRKAGLPQLYKNWSELNYGNVVASMHDTGDRSARAARQYGTHRTLADTCANGDAEAICDALNRHYMDPICKLMEENPSGTVEP